jgi:NADH-quinone oxidoreductase subunit L
MAHESPLVMTLPLMVLAALAVAGGYMGIYPEPLAGFLHQVPHPEGADATTLLVVSSVLVIVGFAVAWLYYKPGAASDRLEENARPFYRFLASRLWFDEVYGWYVEKVQQRLALLLEFFEHFLIAGLFVRGSAVLAGLVGIITRGSVTGNIQGYAYWFFGGLVALWLLIVGVAR